MYLRYYTIVSTSTSFLDDVNFEELAFLKGIINLLEEKVGQEDMEESADLQILV